MNRGNASMIVLSLSVIWFTACRSQHFEAGENQSPQPTQREREPSNPTQHWIQDEELQRLMERLGAKTAEHWPATLPDDPESATTASQRAEAFQSGARLASALADAAGQIPRVVENVGLSDADKSAFIGTARLLGDQARSLNGAARQRNVEEMQKLLEATRATCISCHTRFKDIAGALPPRA